jgi:outer membrane protein assembly factor BamE
MHKSFICLLMMLILSGCSFFQVRKPIIEQGNIITSENAGRLHTGMSPEEVKEVMGTPVLSNIFTANRMEYVYTYQERTNPRITKRVICVFSGGRLVGIQRM